MKKSSILALAVLHLVMLVSAQTLPPAGAPTSAVLPQRIDTHTHYIPPFYRDLLVPLNLTSPGFIPPWNASDHLAVNSQLGIVKSIVSVSVPGAKIFPNDPVQEGRTLARQLNEYGYNLTMEYPDHFLFFATLTLPDLDGAVAESIYALDTLGAAGVIIFASIFGEIMGTPRYAPLYKVLNDRKAVVFIHPGSSPCPQVEQQATATADSSLDLSDLSPIVVDFLLDTTRAALNLVYHNVTANYPDIKFILAHSGGFLPFALVRATSALANLPGGGGPLQAPVYVEELSEFYVDLAISASKPALASTTAFFNDTQITYGSDFPFFPIQGIVQNTDEFLAFHLLKSARGRIDYDNAYQLFKKFLQ